MGRPSVVAAAGAAAAVATSYLVVRAGHAEVVDRPARHVLARPLGDRADVVLGAVTDLGSVYGLGGLSATLAATGRPRVAADVAAAGLVAWVVAQAAKPALDRPRPYQLATASRLVAVPAGSSWPSGHAAVAAATATALQPHLSGAGRAGAWSAVGAVAASRLYVGVHHLTDVVAGVGVGVLSANATAGARRALAGRRRRGAGISPPTGAATDR